MGEFTADIKAEGGAEYFIDNKQKTTIKGKNMSWKQPNPSTTTVNALFYGKSGQGKTRAAGTMNRDAKKVNTLVLNTEGGGWQTIKQQLGYTPYVVDVDNYKTIVAAIDKLEKDPEGIENVIVDSVTELAELVLDDITKGTKPKINDFGTLSKRLGLILRRLRDLPMNVTFTALASETKLNDAIVGEEPDIIGSTSRLLPALVDVVFYIGSVETKDGAQYMAQTAPAKGRIAKIRGAELPHVISTQDVWGDIRESFGIDNLKTKTQTKGEGK